ncbi:MAG: exodeoxyribonuclease VII small subunit [Chloroflexia bacterium]|nr:exodeoxyribonuclease VII small subunit [Chloroflexia bacterium]
MESRAATAANLTGLSFEQALTRLQEMVGELEGGGLTLDETIATFQQGSELASHCQHMITDAELRITELTEATDDGVPQQPDAGHTRLQIPGL